MNVNEENSISVNSMKTSLYCVMNFHSKQSARENLDKGKHMPGDENLPGYIHLPVIILSVGRNIALPTDSCR